MSESLEPALSPVLSRAINGVIGGSNNAPGWIGGADIQIKFKALAPQNNEMTGVILGTGDLTTSCAYDWPVRDNEGVYRNAGVNSPLWYGARKVTYHPMASETADTIWATTNSTITAIDDYFDVAFSDVSNSQARYHNSNSVGAAGDTLIASVWLRGTGNLNFALRDPSANESNEITITLSSTWTRYTVALTMATAQTFMGINLYVNSGVANAATNFQFKEPLLELATGRADTITPSEYIPTTTAVVAKHYSTENPNKGFTQLIDDTNDLTKLSWTRTGSVAELLNAEGIYGEANTASTVSFNTTSDKIQYNVSHTPGTRRVVTTRAYVKHTIGTHWVVITVQDQGGSENEWQNASQMWLSPQNVDGKSGVSIWQSEEASCRVIRKHGDEYAGSGWTVCYFQHTIPEDSDDTTLNACSFHSPNLVQDVIIGNVECFDGATIEDVEKIPPTFNAVNGVVSEPTSVEAGRLQPFTNLLARTNQLADATYWTPNSGMTLTLEGNNHNERVQFGSEYHISQDTGSFKNIRPASGQRPTLDPAQGTAVYRVWFHGKVGKFLDYPDTGAYPGVQISQTASLTTIIGFNDFTGNAWLVSQGNYEYVNINVTEYNLTRFDTYDYTYFALDIEVPIAAGDTEGYPIIYPAIFQGDGSTDLATDLVNTIMLANVEVYQGRTIEDMKFLTQPVMATGTTIETEYVRLPNKDNLWLQTVPTVTNSCLQSNDQTITWQNTTPATITKDQVGLTGEPNTACLIVDDDGVASTEPVQQIFTIPSDTNTHTVAVYIKKDDDETRFPAILVGTVGANYYRTQINTKTGALATPNSAGSPTIAREAVDVGDWWKLCISWTNITQTDFQIWIEAANGSVFGAEDGAATGSCIIGNVELYLNKAIAQVRDLPPIFTTTTAVTTAKTNYTFDEANHDDTKGIWSLEAKYPLSGAEIAALSVGHERVLATVATASTLLYMGSGSGQIFTRDGTTTETARSAIGPAYNINKIALTYSTDDALKSITVNKLTGNDDAYDGSFDLAASPLQLDGNHAFSTFYRNIQQYDITNYAAGVRASQIITGEPDVSELIFHALAPSGGEMTDVLSGTGGLTATHASTLYAPDNQNVYRPFAANEPVYSGVRTVTNSCLYTEDFTQTEWTANTTNAITSNITDPLGGTDACEVGINAQWDVFRGDIPAPTCTLGDVFIVSFWGRVTSGSPTFQVYIDAAASATEDWSPTTEWKKYSFAITVATASAACNFAIQARTAANTGTIQIAFPQVELANGRTDAITPSEYIPTTSAAVTKHFTTVGATNGSPNAVVDNVVTENARAVTNLAYYSEDVSDATWAKDGLTADDATTLSATAQSAARIHQLLVSPESLEIEADGVYIVSFNAQLLSGSLGSNDLRVRLGAKDFNVSNPITSTEQRITITLNGLTNPADKYLSIYPSVGSAVTYSVKLTNIQLERVDNHIDQTAPSEYVATTTAGVTEAFSGGNPNTVASNVVTAGSASTYPIALTDYWLNYVPAITNTMTGASVNSRDLTGWGTVNTPVRTYDQVGITGEANTATLIDFNSAVSGCTITNQTVPNDNATHSVKVWVNKTATEDTITIDMRVLNGTESRMQGDLDIPTGGFTPITQTNGDYEVLDIGDWWVVCTEVTNNTTGNTELRWAFTSKASSSNSITIGQVEVHRDKTIALVRGLPPTFTTTAAVSTAATVYSFDIANNDGDTGAYYCELSRSLASTEYNSIGQQGYITTVSSSAEPLFQRNVGSDVQSTYSTGGGYVDGQALSLDIDATLQLAVTYSSSEGKAVINANGVEGTESSTFDGLRVSYSEIRLFEQSGSYVHAVKMRNLRRYSINTYAAGISVIDKLMP